MAKKIEVKAGDLVKVYTKIKEGNKERVTQFQGIVTQTRGTNAGKTFTVRKISAGIGIERIFPLHSPLITKVEVKKRGKVRRAKLTYLKKRMGKRMKIRESSRKTDEIGQVTIEGPPADEMVVKEPAPEGKEETAKEKKKEEKKESQKEHKKEKPEGKKKKEASAQQKKEKPEAPNGGSAPGQKSVEKS